jgi:hypothetical protein
VEILLRHVVGAAGPVAAWGTEFCAITIAIFVLYVGIAMVAVLRADDVDKAEIRYRVFHDLLELFRDLLELFRLRGRR